MKVEILIVSFRRDHGWCEFALQSIQKFGHGFSGITLLVPDVDETLFRLYEKPYGCRVKTFKERPAPFGMIHHMIMIGRADEICPEADVVFHVDSDCFFTEPFGPEDYMEGPKPILLFANYTKLPPHMPWKPVVNANLKIDWPWETMRRLPLLHIPETYRKLRSEVERLHGKPFEDYVFSCKHDFPEGFCEFNCLGAIAMRHFADRYLLMDVGSGPYPKNKMLQFWSRQGPEKEIEYWHEGKPFKGVPLTIMESILAQ